MLILAADPDPRSKIVHQKASFCLRQVLKPRNPKIFQENFIAVLILATGAFSIDASHERRIQISTQTQRSVTFERGVFPGAAGRAKRMRIYTFCLSNMVRFAGQSESKKLFLDGGTTANRVWPNNQPDSRDPAFTQKCRCHE